jgi:hypothetical protein
MVSKHVKACVGGIGAVDPLARHEVIVYHNEDQTPETSARGRIRGTDRGLLGVQALIYLILAICITPFTTLHPQQSPEPVELTA